VEFYLDYECAWSLLGGAGVLASPFQAMHGLASPLTAAYGSASVGGRHPNKKTHTSFPHESTYQMNFKVNWVLFCFFLLFLFTLISR
jgi:hypothetical protein